MKNSHELLYAGSYSVLGETAEVVLRRMAKLAKGASVVTAFVVFVEPKSPDDLPFEGFLTIEPAQ